MEKKHNFLMVGIIIGGIILIFLLSMLLGDGGGFSTLWELASVDAKLIFIGLILVAIFSR
jgi:hypothetical protein